ncbi:MAG: AAC(3) family N-acetyltransferase [Fimbriimonas sp.]|nr:AAC(3) family N-acetyltransferase [Fimbriimonas sp.]
MSWTQESLVSDLRSLGIRQGDSVLTHSSFKSLGQGGSPSDLIAAMLDAVGPNGTALFPAHTWVDASPETPPTFDVCHTPSAKVGIVPETARLWPGAIRSVHPTHSVTAIGADAQWITEGHYDDGICGIGSPYDRLCSPRSGTGLILLLGVDQERNTSLHMIEEVVDVPGALIGPGICRVTGYDGIERLREGRFHSWRPRRFMVLDEDLDRLGIQTKGVVASAPCRLVQAGRLREFVSERLRENPDYLWDTSS